VAAFGLLTAVATAMIQDACLVLPGRLLSGRVRVMSRRWWGRAYEVHGLVLSPDMTDGIESLYLCAVLQPGRREIVRDAKGGAAARALAGWLSSVAHIPIEESDGRTAY